MAARQGPFQWPNRFRSHVCSTAGETPVGAAAATATLGHLAKPPARAVYGPDRPLADSYSEGVAGPTPSASSRRRSSSMRILAAARIRRSVASRSWSRENAVGSEITVSSATRKAEISTVTASRKALLNASSDRVCRAGRVSTAACGAAPPRSLVVGGVAEPADGRSRHTM